MDKVENKKIVKIGIVVRDIEDVAKRYAELFDVPVPAVRVPDPSKPPMEGTYKNYRGENNRILLKSCIVDMEPIYLEIVEPFDDTPSPWLDHLEKFGPSVCFISFYIHGFKMHQDLMGKCGYPLAFVEEKGFERYAYFDTQDKLGVMIEFKEQD